MSDRFKIKSFIKNQFPEFVREDHSKFVSFMEAYYEWLDSNSQNIRSVSQLKNLYDIDETLDLFIEDFKKTYLSSFPINLVIDPLNGKKLSTKKLLKNIKDFYKAKGVKKSYSFIFRLFYDSDVEIYYPKEYVLSSSDGRWIQEKKIYLRPENPSSIKNLIGRTISQWSIPYDNSSTLIGRARVTSSISYIRNSNYVLELSLEEIYGSFSSNQIVLDIETGENYGTSYSVLSNITVTDRGSGYEQNQRLNFVKLSTSLPSYLPSARIKRTSSGIGESDGQVLELSITDPGLFIDSSNCGLSGVNPIDQVGATGGTGFQASLSFGPLFQKNEYYLGTKGLLSSDMVLQDNHKYQEYSYVIRTDMSLSRYLDVVKGLLHPAGTELFSEILLSRCLIGDPNAFLNIPQKEVKRIGNYLPYTFVTFDDLSQWFDGSCYATGTHDSLIVGASVTGNPLSSGVIFTAATTGCLTADLPTGLTPNYWLTFPHPNIRIKEGVVYIYTNQLGDFYGPTGGPTGQGPTGWQEWNLSSVNGGTTADQIEWLLNTLNNENGRDLASLLLDKGTTFRKIPIYAFLNDVSCSYDCRYGNNCLEQDS